MFRELTFAFSLCVAMSLVALAYGEYASIRQARGRPITVKERFRNLLALYAIALSVASLLFIVWTGLPLGFVFQELRQVAAVALAPLLLWYIFDLPLRLIRHLSSARRPNVNRPHPLDGQWPQASSFLDEITESRGRTTGLEVDQAPKSADLSPDVIEPKRPRTSALDRVAQLRPDEVSLPKPS